MEDSQIINAAILVPSGCRVADHVFTWTGGAASIEPLSPDYRCGCKLYTWQEWVIEKMLNGV